MISAEKRTRAREGDHAPDPIDGINDAKRRNETEIEFILQTEAVAYRIANTSTNFRMVMFAQHASRQIADGLAALYKVAQEFQRELASVPQEMLPQAELEGISNEHLNAYGAPLLGPHIARGAKTLQDTTPQPADLPISTVAGDVHMLTSGPDANDDDQKMDPVTGQVS